MNSTDTADKRASIDRVVVINDFATARGGATVIALESVRQYRRLGYPVTFINGEASTDELDALGVSVIGLDSKSLLELPTMQALRLGIRNDQAVSVIADWISQHDTPRTVYHVHNWSQILSPAIYHALRPVEKRVIATCHDFFNICPNGGYFNYQASRACNFRPLSANCLLSQCDRRSSLHKYWRVLRQYYTNHLAHFKTSDCTFTFLHKGMQEKFVRSGFTAKDLIAIPNPVEPWSSERIRAEENTGFLFVGRIGRDKGADIAIRAAREAGQKLTLVGSGEIGADASPDDPHINFVGWRDKNEIIEYARTARALIAPSRMVEPFGLVILEAAASGLPVIVSSHAFLAEDVKSGEFGSTFDISEPSELTALLGRLATDDGLVENMSKAGISNASNYFLSPENWIAAFVETFERKLRQCAGTANTG